VSHAQGASTAAVLEDRRHTLRKKLRLYCMPKRLHRCLGAVGVRVAFKGGQSLDATSHRDTALSQFGPGGRCTGWRCSPLQSISWRKRAPQRGAASETREGGTVGEPGAGGGRGQRGRTHWVAAGPPAPVLGGRRHTRCKKLRLYCMPERLQRVLGDRRKEPVGGATGRMAGPGRPTVAVHLQERKPIPPHHASHSLTGGADKRGPASSIQATGSAWAALEAGLIRPAPPLSLLLHSSSSSSSQQQQQQPPQP